MNTKTKKALILFTIGIGFAAWGWYDSNGLLMGFITFGLYSLYLTGSQND